MYISIYVSRCGNVCSFVLLLIMFVVFTSIPQLTSVSLIQYYLMEQKMSKKKENNLALDGYNVLFIHSLFHSSIHSFHFRLPVVVLLYSFENEEQHFLQTHWLEFYAFQRPNKRNEICYTHFQILNWSSTDCYFHRQSIIHRLLTLIDNSSLILGSSGN